MYFRYLYQALIYFYHLLIILYLTKIKKLSILATMSITPKPGTKISMSETPEIQTVRLAADFGPEEVARIDYVAALNDPTKPNRSSTLRLLVRKGYDRFIQERAEQNATPAPAVADQ